MGSLYALTRKKPEINDFVFTVKIDNKNESRNVCS